MEHVGQQSDHGHRDSRIIQTDVVIENSNRPWLQDQRQTRTRARHTHMTTSTTNDPAPGVVRVTDYHWVLLATRGHRGTTRRHSPSAW